MRSLSSTLKAAQQSGSQTPYVYVRYYNGSSWVDATSDVRRCRIVLEQYGGYGTIVLNNSASTYDSFDYEGESVRVAPGLVTGGGNEYSEWPYFFIDSFSWVGQPGKSDLVISLGTNYDKLARAKENRGSGHGDGEYIYNDTDVWALGNEDTIKEIIDDLCSEAGVTLGTSVSEDSIVDDKTPFMFIVPKDEDRLTTILRLLRQTECELILQGDEVKLIHPTTSDSVTATYQQTPGASDTFFLFADQRAQSTFAPNKVTVISSVAQIPIDNVAGSWSAGQTLTNLTHSGSATITAASTTYVNVIGVDAEEAWEDNDSLQTSGGGTANINNSTYPDSAINYPETTGSYTWPGVVDTWEYTEVLAAYDTQYTSSECAAMAQDIVERYERRSRKGQLRTSVHVGQEIWDYISAVDPWTGKTLTKGRVGRIEIRYVRGSRSPYGAAIAGEYRMSLGLGDYQDLPTNINGDMFVTGGALGQGYISESGAVIRRNLAADALRQASQSYKVDVQVYAKDDDEIYWGAGRIHFADGSTLTINARAVGSALTLDYDTEYLYFEEGDSDLHLTGNPFVPVSIKHGLVATVFKASDSSQNAVIWPFNGKVPYINGEIICADAIIGNHVQANTLNFEHMESMPCDNVLENPRLENGTNYVVNGWDNLETGKGDNSTGYAHRYSGGAYSRTTNQNGVEMHSDTGASNIECATDHYTAGEGEVWTAEGWFRAENAGQDDEIRICVSFRDYNGDLVSETNSSWLAATVTYTQLTVTAKAPATTAYVRIELHVSPDASWEGNWHGTDFRLYRSSQIIVHGTPSGASVLIGEDATEGFGIFGYNSTPTLQFYIKATDGKGYFGGGNCVLDSTGLLLTDYPVYFYVGDLSGDPVAGMGIYDATTFGLSVEDLNYELLIGGSVVIKTGGALGGGGDITIETLANDTDVNITGERHVNIEATDGDVNISTSTADVDIDSADQILLDAGTNVEITGAADVTLTATADDIIITSGDDTVLNASGVINLRADGGGAEGTGNINFNCANVLPASDGITTLGSSSKAFDNLYVDSIHMNESGTGAKIYAQGNKQGDIGEDTVAFDDVYADDFQNKSPFLSPKEYLGLLDDIRVDMHTGEILGGKDFPCYTPKYVNGEEKPRTGIGSKQYIELFLGCIAELREKVTELEERLDGD